MAFGIPLAAAAANIEYTTARNWIDRRVVNYADDDHTPHRQGDRALLTTRRVLQLALTGELTKIGVLARKAAMAAAAFTDHPHGVDINGNRVERVRGELFASGATFFVYTPDRPSGTVVNAPADAAYAAIARAAGGGRIPPGCAIIDMAPLVERVATALRRAA